MRETLVILFSSANKKIMAWVHLRSLVNTDTDNDNEERRNDNDTYDKMIPQLSI